MTGIALDSRIVEQWTQRAADGFLGLDMALSSGAPAAKVIMLLREIVDGLVAEHERVIEMISPQPGDEPPWPGEWHPVELSDGGVGIRVYDCDRADVFVPRVVRALEDQGIDGELGLYQWPPAPELPARALVLECRLLPRGARIHIGDRTYHWKSDRAARDRLVTLAGAWLRRGDERSAPVLKVGPGPAVLLGPADEIASKMLSELDSSGGIKVHVATDYGFRIITWSRNHQQVALIHAVGQADQPDGWPAYVRDLTEVLLRSADASAYGYIKRGSSPARARNGYSLAEDWPQRGGHGEREIYRSSTGAFYDEYAPDAFATQLLGPGYAGRIPRAPSYERRAIADSVLLEHKDPSAWYERSFVPPNIDARHINEAAPPTVLRCARAELDPILFRPEVIPDA